jgi:glycosyltransferase involved in cell wall biosynthesis
VTLNLNSAGDVFPIWINPTIPREIQRGDFDAVICTGWDSLTTVLARAACRIQGVPFILWAGSTSRERNWRRSLTLWPVSVLVRSAQACIAYGTAARSYLTSLGARNVFISYNTVDVQLFHSKSTTLRARRAELKRTLGIDAATVVAYVGQLIERKGVLTLARALRHIRMDSSTAMLWVGYGPLLHRLKLLAEEMPMLKHHFAIAHTVDEVCQFYAVADASVLPSYEEVWGLVVNESLASGVPVVTTNAVGSAYDLIQEGVNGFVVPPGDHVALADRINRILVGCRSHEKWTDNARASMRGFTYDQNVAAFKSAVTAVLWQPQ